MRREGHLVDYFPARNGIAGLECWWLFSSNEEASRREKRRMRVVWFAI